MEKNLIDDFKLMGAFKIFDKENKGYISVENLKDVLALEDDMEGYILNVIVRQVDDNGDGKISFDEFKDMMFSNTVIPPKPSKSGRSARRRQNRHEAVTNRSRRNKNPSRGSRSSSSGESSVASISIASDFNLAISPDMFESDSVARKQLHSDDMSVASFAHVYHMFDDKISSQKKQRWQQPPEGHL
jgi:hypothetical protein